MLSRHILRIKLVQSVFAYEQHKSANRQLALDTIEAPNVELVGENKRKKAAAYTLRTEVHRILGKYHSVDELDHIADPTLKETAHKALKYYRQHNEKDLLAVRRDLLSEVTQITRRYHTVLDLIASFADIAAELNAKQHAPFCNNVFILALRHSRPAPTSKPVGKIAAKEAQREHELQVEWFREILYKNVGYSEYIHSSVEGNWDVQIQFIKYLMRNLILKGRIDDHMAEQDIRWAENRHVIKGMLEKTIKTFDPTQPSINIPTPSPDWKADAAFLEDLFDNTVSMTESRQEIIANHTKNWDVGRLPLIDRVVLELAIAELIQRQEIPVKVTINEYVEIAKKYSSSNSPQFVNGILDTIATKLQESGEVQKSGRGLIDNR